MSNLDLLLVKTSITIQQYLISPFIPSMQQQADVAKKVRLTHKLQNDLILKLQVDLSYTKSPKFNVSLEVEK